MSLHVSYIEFDEVYEVKVPKHEVRIKCSRSEGQVALGSYLITEENLEGRRDVTFSQLKRAVPST